MCWNSKTGAVGALRRGTYVRVTVADNGTGMPKEVLDRAFEPFFTTKERGKGTGLGLSQVHGFIAQSGGDVVVTSEPNRGTQIDLYLPRLAGEEQSRSVKALDLSTETLLLVEDEPDLLSAAAEMLRSIGYEVIAVSNATEALEVLASRTEIDVVFSDIVMPQSISGIELARYIKAHYPEIHIVLTSAYPLATLRREHGELAEFVFVHKPYRLSDVARAIRTFR